jgi:hypothetical protein
VATSGAIDPVVYAGLEFQASSTDKTAHKIVEGHPKVAFYVTAASMYSPFT